MIITIDGPAGSGKSTAARMLADQLGFLFLNTGSMYRAIGLKAIRENIDCENDAALERVANESHIDYQDGHVLLDDEDVTTELYREDVSAAASKVAVCVGVRKVLVRLQQQVAAGRNVVTEGRDQGTVVFPDAELKIFLTASDECRAKRRYSELLERGDEPEFDEILAQIQERDARDCNREVAPLKPANDAVLVDSSPYTLDEVVEKLVSTARDRIR
ncbi:(d)CMP kinase [Calycomorphotria hydatis]|uniref:Cytidylate kinase n=1 Tax=Calycomorphotria hydatis TaxID=2528027 RepID=A0A517T4H2_9PLAN|nr:(d)CMP kinase [Calycomorphotria hydatis]QDT63286.1 Cytidylate kinase [Calycomorphotria hydatis]